MSKSNKWVHPEFFDFNRKHYDLSHLQPKKFNLTLKRKMTIVIA
jgi:hypothetical protein